jgi:DNA-binding MarR family transcriptional regulator
MAKDDPKNAAPDNRYRFLHYMIRRMHQTADALYYDEAAQFDMTPVQLAALRAIQVRPGFDQLRLAHAIKLDRTTVAGVVLRLEKKGLITRGPAPHDRRSNLLSLTPAGDKLLEDLIPAAECAQRRMLAGFTPDERKALLDLLERLVDQDEPAQEAAKNG